MSVCICKYAVTHTRAHIKADMRLFAYFSAYWLPGCLHAWLIYLLVAFNSRAQLPIFVIFCCCYCLFQCLIHIYAHRSAFIRQQRMNTYIWLVFLLWLKCAFFGLVGWLADWQPTWLIVWLLVWHICRVAYFWRTPLKRKTCRNTRWIKISFDAL